MLCFWQFVNVVSFLLCFSDVYYNVKPSYLHEPQACNCKVPEGGVKGCGDDCINRLVYTECSPGICPLRDQCCNQRIQKHDWAPGLERFMTKEKVLCSIFHKCSEHWAVNFVRDQGCFLVFILGLGSSCKTAYQEWWIYFGVCWGGCIWPWVQRTNGIDLHSRYSSLLPSSRWWLGHWWSSHGRRW